MMKHDAVADWDAQYAARFVVATSALADLVVLRIGPLTLPRGCDAPVTTDADVAYWRDVAAAAWAARHP